MTCQALSRSHMAGMSPVTKNVSVLLAWYTAVSSVLGTGEAAGRR